MRHPWLAFLAFAATLAAAEAGAQTSPAAPIHIAGQAGDDGFGWSVAPAGDVTGDGITDLVVGVPTNDAVQAFGGRAYVFHGPLAGPLGVSDADSTLSTLGFGDNLGVSVASAGDVNGDGISDLLVGARGDDSAGIQAGRVSLFLGPITERLAASAEAVISGTPFQEIGRAVASAGDLNGDGFDDILVGADIAGTSREGRVYVFNGPITGPLSIANATAVLVGALPDDFFGTSLAAAGDLNGDGFDDIVVGASRLVALGNTQGPGRVFVFHGRLSGTIGALSADAVLTGDLLNDAFGVSVGTGDVNGDKVTDLVVGAHQLFRDDGTGKAYVFHGPLSGAIAASSAAAVVQGEGLAHLFGNSLAVADFDQDGRGDLAVGAPGFAAGRVYVFRGPLAGAIGAGSAPFVATGAPGSELGHSVSAGDLDGDGVPEPVFGAPSLSAGGPGFVALFPEPLPPKARARRSR